MDIDDLKWRIVIHQSRYGGVYEGGEWFAIFCGDEFPEDAIGSDCECMDFWMSEIGKKCGIGRTPNEALEDLYRKDGEASVLYGQIYSIPQGENNGTQDRDDT